MYTRDQGEKQRERGAAALERARLVAPVVAAAGPEISATARLPDRIVAALVEADLFRLATPLAYGGVQCDLATFATISQVIGRADMSAAWCIVQGNASVHSLAPRLDPDAGREPSANLVP